MFRAGSVLFFLSFSVSRSVIMFSYISPLEMRPNINVQEKYILEWSPQLHEIKMMFLEIAQQQQTHDTRPESSTLINRLTIALVWTRAVRDAIWLSIFISSLMPKSIASL